MWVSLPVLGGGEKSPCSKADPPGGHLRRRTRQSERGWGESDNRSRPIPSEANFSIHGRLSHTKYLNPAHYPLDDLEQSVGRVGIVNRGKNMLQHLVRSRLLLYRFDRGSAIET